ncbi:uncharacterized protein LACBIDRAFT_311589 [Laccaria bicolor S238N-H82]|uniref:non-specific serine/threonine protein kinase n=1 Tax=Laccaria bicolor (strain S238N-H82 / ATCC MYA-4686) TaxID=486041 RepID=B0CXR9_LACBS|nr:uncharacterized protein LACBIDRAFT_311589 [Laccaria bicolor S238N-H82]EDR12771.1 predicted protein [Laccaria bicolor S238N-H82]|eukprot:XP_001877035.1 predicted protein [Laccaria bicolor S238N-H82]
MLGARTKQINAYGKRNRRVVDASTERSRPIGTEIISIFDDLPPAPPLASLASKMKKRENAAPSKHKALSPKCVGKGKPRRLSPVLSPPRKKTTRVAQIIDAARRADDSGAPILRPKPKPLPSGLQGDPIILSASPPRAPLSAVSLNVPGSPAVSTKPQTRQKLGLTKVNPKLNKPFSPFVNMDIIVLDDGGQIVKKEHRVSRKKPEHDPKGRRSATRTTVPSRLQAMPIPISIDSTDTESEASQVRRPKRSVKRAPPIILTDTESEEEDTLQPSAPSQQMAESSAHTRPNNAIVEVVIPPAPYPIHVAKITHPSEPPLRNESASSPSSQPPSHPVIQPPAPRFQLPTSPLVKARQLTPIRGRHGKRLFEPPSPPSPSTPTDLELSLDFSDFNLGSPSQRNAFYSQISIPEHLQALLEECGQEQCGPHEFSAFIESFPYDPIIQSSDNTDTRFRKIGEASYSEVFGIGDVVLKVIPLRDESEANVSQSRLKMTTKYSEERPAEEVDGPAPSDAKDVRKEIIVTRAMGEVYGGFIKLLKTYVVRGRYPEVLLNLWDYYNEKKGSESVRPDSFNVSQVYAIIVLPNGGSDLEAYTFLNAGKSGWKQACSIFWQVTKALGHAEQLVSFEHRDLHWGQILVKNVVRHAPLKALSVNQKAKAKRQLHMDDLAHGVQATVIDLGLSRMDAGDGHDGDEVQWTPFDDEVFMGEGDYQFDVYRMMKDVTGGTWEAFHPITNVMWLHYLALKLLQGKGLKPPTALRKGKGPPESQPVTTNASFTERDCYDCLVDIENWLGSCLVKKGKGRRKVDKAATGPICAGEIVGYGVKRGWINPSVMF